MAALGRLRARARPRPGASPCPRGVASELALPGSAYLYQGEELGLHEVAEIDDTERQDPAFFRNPGVDAGRDGCRVPLPWTTSGRSFGFGEGPSHLPQPDWFGASSVEAEDADPDSTLNLYRRALEVRPRLLGGDLAWVDMRRGVSDVLAFERGDGWLCVTNFGDEPVELPEGEVELSSEPVQGGLLPGGVDGLAPPLSGAAAARAPRTT